MHGKEESCCGQGHQGMGGGRVGHHGMGMGHGMGMWHHMGHGMGHEMGHDVSKEMKLARMKAALIILQAQQAEIEKRIKHMEECDEECGCGHE